VWCVCCCVCGAHVVAACDMCVVCVLLAVLSAWGGSMS
jgi:hypothetical protein